MKQQDVPAEPQDVPAELPDPAEDGSVSLDEVRDQTLRARDELGETLEQLAQKADLPAQARRRAARAELMARDTVARAAELIRAQRPQRVWAAARRTADGGNRGVAGMLAAGSAGVVAATAVWRRYRRRRAD
jgi:hypothetical protein